jgi:hypothetical protein
MRYLIKSEVFEFDKKTNTFTATEFEVEQLSSTWKIGKKIDSFYIISQTTNSIKQFNILENNKTFLKYISNCKKFYAIIKK